MFEAGEYAHRLRCMAHWRITLASFEGALVLARTYRDLEPLELVRRETHALVRAELEAKR